MMYNIISTTIKTMEDVYEGIRNVYKHRNSILMAFDTETDGLNIHYSMPFLLQFGFYYEESNTIYTYAIDLELSSKELIQTSLVLFDYMCSCAIYLDGHNITFDMHMMRNFGHPISSVYYSKLIDTQTLIRLTEESVPTDKGGPPLGLKDYVYRYIDKSAKLAEHELKEEQTYKLRQATFELSNNLRNVPIIDSFRVTGTERKWTKKMVEGIINDSLLDIEDYPKELQNPLRVYQQRVEEIENYKNLNRENVIKYGHLDIVYTLSIHLHCIKRISTYGQEAVFDEERAVIVPFYNMESNGRRFNMPYAYEVKKILKEYILNLRQKLKNITQLDVKANQFEVLKNYFNGVLDYEIEGTSKEILKTIDHPAASVIEQIRTLEKWYITYLVGWLKDAKKYHTDRVYPTYNASGAVTGRTSSSFQQFPKGEVVDDEGNSLFIPRKLFINEEDYTMFYLDFDAMELRLLANYTMLLKQPDVNLCRAFIPYDCIEKEGKHYLKEKPTEEWHELDPHAMTASMAFNIEIDRSIPEHEKLRAQGKKTNFAIVYGAGIAKLAGMLHEPYEIAEKFYKGFYRAYPSVRIYENYIKNTLASKGFVPNLFGRNYFGISAHKGKNYAIQGSGGDYTKQILIELNELFKGKKSQIILYLHDEFGFSIHKTERYLIPLIKEIMEQLDTPIKMTVSVEYADNDWSDKIDYRE